MKTYRILGMLSIISSLAILPYMLKSNVDTTQPTLVTSLLGLIFQLGCLCSALGLFQMHAAGNGSAGKIILLVQMTLHALAAIFQVLEYQQLGMDSLLWTITDIGWPLGFLFMLVTGGAVIRARRLQGWQRYVALSCAFPLPVTMLSGALIGEEIGGYLFGVGLFVTYLLLALTVFRYNEDETPVMVAQPSF